MNKSLKVTLITVFALFLLLFLPIIPTKSTNLESGVLLQIKRVGGIAGFDDMVNIYSDGKIQYSKRFNLPDVPLKFANEKISQEQLIKLNNLISSGKYFRQRYSIASKIFPSEPYPDQMWESYTINKNGKMISILRNDEISGIINEVFTIIQSESKLP